MCDCKLWDFVWAFWLKVCNPFYKPNVSPNVSPGDPVCNHVWGRMVGVVGGYGVCAWSVVYWVMSGSRCVSGDQHADV